MVARIIVKPKSTDKESKEHSLDFSQDSITLGRQESNDVPLPGQGVSRTHAMIVAQDNDFYLIDLESRNGTILNDRKLKPKEKNLLRDNDIITIGDFKLTFKVEDFVFTEENQEGTTTIRYKMVEELLKVLGTGEDIPVLKVIGGVEDGKVIELTKDVRKILIGRGEECDLVLPHKSVSRTHAEVSQDWGGEITISDLNSTNGTLVNDRFIKTNYRLKDRDYITLGTVRLIFLDPRDTSSKQFDVPEPIGKEEVEKGEVEKSGEEENKEKSPSVTKEGKEETPPPSPEINPTTNSLETIFLIIGGVLLTGAVILTIWLLL